MLPQSYFIAFNGKKSKIFQMRCGSLHYSRHVISCIRQTVAQELDKIHTVT